MWGRRRASRCHDSAVPARYGARQKKLAPRPPFANQLVRRRERFSRGDTTTEKELMKYGARNKITAKVTSIKSDQIMSLVKFDVATPTQMASVLTTESVQELGLKVGDSVQLIIKAIHVLPVKE